MGSLVQERKKNNVFPVIGEGSHYAEIMFVGEAPGKNEAENAIEDLEKVQKKEEELKKEQAEKEAKQEEQLREASNKEEDEN